ncbi:MAG: hypothetical protein AB7P99_00970 [Vicinamibacterales bacterium]
MTTRIIRPLFAAAFALALASPSFARQTPPEPMSCDHEKCAEHCKEQMAQAKTGATAERHMAEARSHQRMAASYRGTTRQQAAPHCDREAQRHRDAAAATRER